MRGKVRPRTSDGKRCVWRLKVAPSRVGALARRRRSPHMQHPAFRRSPPMSADPIVIVSYARTPMGGFQGALAGASATELGAVAVKAAVERAAVAPEAVEQILMGCVLPAGLGQAPARQAALKAGLPLSVEATTVNKMCGSGMQAAILGHDLLAAGTAKIVVAGGMESMTNAPYLLAKHRGGARIGHDRVMDSM